MLVGGAGRRSRRRGCVEFGGVARRKMFCDYLRVVSRVVIQGHDVDNRRTDLGE